MRRLRDLAEEYGFVLGYLALAALAAGLVRYLIWRQMDAWAEGLLIGGVVSGALFTLARPAEVKAALTGRGARYGSNAVLMSLAFVGILIGLNYLAGRYHYRYDATELKEHTLSPQSVQVLEELDEQVEIIGFFTAGDYRQEAFDRLLDQYTYRSDFLSYEVIDPDLQPTLARQYDPIPYGGLVIKSGDRTETVQTAGEQDITSAILKVSRDEKKVLYFLTGHQEREAQRLTQFSLSKITDALEDQNYEIRSLNLAVTTTVPADAAVVIVAGPETELLEEEKARLSAYLNQGGKALLMQDPFNDDVGLNEILAQYQVRFGDGVVIDPTATLMGSVAAPVVANYSFSQITQDLPMTFFPLARPVEQTAQELPPGVSFRSLAESSPQSWAEMDTEGEQVQYDEGVDIDGPLTLVATLEADATEGNPDGKTRIVLIGDTDFASNEYSEGLGNGWLFLNAINWLAEEEALIAIGPKGQQPRNVFISAVQGSAILFVSAIFIPLTLLAVGVVVWWRRR